jgi:nitroreductase
MHGSFKKMLRETIHESQKCQRNWDLLRHIPEEDKNLIIESATNCPSKQNLNYYALHVIENRELIEEIHKETKGFGPIYSNYSSEDRSGQYDPLQEDEGVYHTNPQTLANMLLAFTKATPDIVREENDSYDDDRAMAIGIAAGYVNVIATQLGYATGCCKCFNNEKITCLLGDSPILLMGVGFPDKSRDRREHHSEDFKFPSLRKNKNIQVHQHP